MLSTKLRASSFLLSLCSPVLHRMLCGSFVECNAKKLNIYDVDIVTFGKALDLWCGTLSAEMALDEMRELESVADRFQMTEVSSALDESVSNHLSVGICIDVLSWSGGLGLRQSEREALRLATERFNELAQTEGFMQMGEEILGMLLGCTE